MLSKAAVTILTPNDDVPGDNAQVFDYDCQNKVVTLRRRELDNKQGLDGFLASVEKRAFRLANIATGQTDEAFDIVQDSMFKLVEKYSDKPENEWGALFQRILQSKIRDWYRRTKVRNRFRTWLSLDKDAHEGEVADPFQTIADARGRSPEELLDIELSIDSLEQALRNLPLRQQQAFLLRAWEGLSVKQTAVAMACAEGSVKTHYSRALSVLRTKLSAITPDQLQE